MIHRVIYHEEGMFAGWPANHGAWQWGDELLVGFMCGTYTRKPRTHQISDPFKKLQARSRDGGETWIVEQPGVDFEAREVSEPPTFHLGGDSIIRVCGVFDHGGDECHPGGGFYLSSDRGQSWSGAYRFAGIEPMFTGEFECSARTSTLGNMILVTNRKAGAFGTDNAFAVTHDGSMFSFLGTVCCDGRRAAMPVVAQVGRILVAAVRRHDWERYWIESFCSHDGGATWQSLSEVAPTSRRNGNPPALAAVNGVLYCAFGDRDAGAICICRSDDIGQTWSMPERIRAGGKSDIGYPQLFVRSDGALVCVYYWADQTTKHQHIAATEIRP